MITETYKALYGAMNDNMQAEAKETLPFEEKMGETVLCQRGEAVDVSSFADLDIESYMQTASCMLFYRPVDEVAMDSAKAQLQKRSLRQTKKRMLRKILCAQVFEACGLDVQGLPWKDALPVFLWRTVYRTYFAVEKGFPFIRRFKDAVKACVRY